MRRERPLCRSAKGVNDNVAHWNLHIRIEVDKQWIMK